LYLVYDTQLIVGGNHRKHQFSIDDYAMAAICLYIDIIQLFLMFLCGRRRARQGRRRRRYTTRCRPLPRHTKQRGSRRPRTTNALATPGARGSVGGVGVPSAAVAAQAPDSTAVIGVQRGAQALELKVQLAERPKTQRER
jgi:hypothetical protein